jgi:methyl acetate hydrolase
VEAWDSSHLRKRTQVPAVARVQGNAGLGRCRVTSVQEYDLGMPESNQSRGGREGAANLCGIGQVLQLAVADRLAGVVAIAASRDKILHQGAFPRKDIDTGEPMAIDTIFQIFSMTKPVTSVAVMQLVERGKVKLDEVVSCYLPDFTEFKILVGFDGRTPQLRSASRGPTVRELLTHTSGYAYPYWSARIARYEEVFGKPEGREAFKALPLVFEPGSRWRYGRGTDVLGILVEAVSGQSLAEYFTENILGPLGMDNTSFQVPSEAWKRVSSRYQREPDGRLGSAAWPLPTASPEVDFFSGGGGLYSTAPDYIRFLQALLNGGEFAGARILERETVDLMAENQIGNYEAGTMTTVQPQISNDINFFPGSKNSFGLGFLINNEEVEGGRAAESLTWAGLLNTYFWIDRTHNVCGVLVTQIFPFGDAAVLELLHDYEKAVCSRFVFR